MNYKIIDDICFVIILAIIILYLKTMTRVRKNEPDVFLVIFLVCILMKF